MTSPSSQNKDECSPVYFKLRKKLKSGQDSSEKPNPIEQIISKKMGGDNIWYYEVKWRNTPCPCWEPIDKLQSYKEMIEKFEKFNFRKETKEKILLEGEEKEKPIKRIKQKPGQKEIPSRIEYSEGKFELGDRAKDIILMKIVKNEFSNEKEMFCLVEWMTRSNGATPLCTLVNTKELRKYEPGLLIDFYEKKVVFYTVPITMARTEELYSYYYSDKK